MRAEASIQLTSSPTVVRSLLFLFRVAHSSAFYFTGALAIRLWTISNHKFGQHVSFFPLEGKSEQDGQAGQEVLPRADEVETAAELEQPACGEVG